MEMLTRVGALLLCLATLLAGISTDPTSTPSEEPVVTTTTVPTEVTEPTEEKIELNPNPVLFEDIVYSEPITKSYANEYLLKVQEAIDSLTVLCTSEEYTETAISSMTTELERLNNIYEELIADIDKFTVWEEEYPYATQVWFFMRENGISAEVTAGIIGNMMMETSGGTLALKPFIYGVGHYGLCQWSLYYKPFMRDTTIEYQLEYLLSDMPVEFGYYGFVYKKNFTYEDFLSLETPEDAALAFVKVYERPGDNSYYARKQAARVAYNYFTTE
jgi:hypothetical protein